MKLMKTRKTNYSTFQPIPSLSRMGNLFILGSGMSDYFFDWEPI